MCLLALHGEWVLGRSVSLTDEITGSCVISGAVCRFSLLCRTHQPTWMVACASDWACAWMAAEICNDSLHCAFLVCKRHELIAGTFFLYYQVAIAVDCFFSHHQRRRRQHNPIYAKRLLQSSCSISLLTGQSRSLYGYLDQNQVLHFNQGWRVLQLLGAIVVLAGWL